MLFWMREATCPADSVAP